MPVADPGPSLDRLRWRTVGEGLNRPESVLATARGEVFVSDHAAGVFCLGQPKPTLQGVPEGFMPNGICLLPQREFLVANLGGAGGVWRIDRDWRLGPWLMEVDGEPLVITNFVGLDAKGRIWISMSTRSVPREAAFNGHTATGFIAVVDEKGARIAVDGIGFTNECRVDPSGRWLYVNETFARRLSRFALNSNGDLGPREVVHQFTDGDFPDGLAFDAEGGAWVACVVSNRVVRIGLDGRYEVIVADADPDLIARAEARYAQGLMGRGDVDSGGRQRLCNVSSIAFGGKDLRTVYLGNLAGSSLISFESGRAGAVPPY